MTREEAEKKVAEAYGMDIRSCHQFVKALEVLNLIKFDESPKSTLMNVVVEVPEGGKVYQVVLRMSNYDMVANIKNCYPPEIPTAKQLYSCGITFDNLKALEEKGYKIVKL
jgi:hypothetical protein